MATVAREDKLFGRYRAAGPGYDEFRDAAGEVRPHWAPLVRAFEALGPLEQARCHEQAQRRIQESGVTLDLAAGSGRRARPWALDPLPLLIDSQQWRQLSQGLIQRARLLNRMLGDLYGPQQLLKHGLLPPELLFAHDGFLRPVHGQKPPLDGYLHFYAADLARSPDGKWWVVADRTEAPSGAAYVLENRLVVSQTFPGIFRDCQVQRLAPFYLTARESLQSLARQHREDPRIVLLTSGPRSSSYFEDAYLARYLGYTLAESGDLAVRNDRVLLKTLAGLVPVDVILRRSASADLDPLELAGDPAQGVPGLMQAVRSGNVALANAPGSGLVESPAFMAFLGPVCRYLLDEDLLLPSVATWWCGGESARKHVLEHLENLVIKPAFRRSDRQPQFGPQMDKAQRQRLAESIAAQPASFVGQEVAARSTAPVWLGQQLESWPLLLRVYLVADGKSYRPLSGGLARLSASPGTFDLSMGAGECSKDVWVLADGPVRQVSLLKPTGQTVELQRSTGELPSRVAENMYWLGRHVARADGTSRVLRTTLLRLTSELELESMPELPRLIRCLAALGQIEPGFAVEGISQQLPRIEQVLPESVFAESQPGSLRYTIDCLYSVGGRVRDRLSADSWRIINRIYQEFLPPDREQVYLRELLPLLNQMLVDLSAFNGLVLESMTRGHGWRFLDIGRRLERSLHLIELLQNMMVDLPLADDDTRDPVLQTVLEIDDSAMTYRSRYRANLQPAPVLDLLLTDESNPRSLAFQLAALADHVQHLPGVGGQARRSEEQRLTMTMLHAVRMADVDALCSQERKADRTPLEALLGRLSGQLPKLSDAISHKYLIHAGKLRHLDQLASGDLP
ncbi:MAG: circularly permuted type 2 ATP-grasp protein [Pirellulaceae bacterium]|nr:circularly permuted type 2 ATP-grasp protein [Pirellulaceae bacterium]